MLEILEHLTWEEAERWGFALDKKAQEKLSILPMCIKIEWEGVKKMKPDFCQWYSGKKQKAQIKMQEVPFKHEKKKDFLMMRVVEYCSMLPREVVQSPHLNIFKIWLDMVLKNVP